MIDKTKIGGNGIDWPKFTPPPISEVLRLSLITYAQFAGLIAGIYFRSAPWHSF